MGRNESTPKVSIIIPTYNRANCLQKAIESSLAQDYTNLEILVSDNASEDETYQVVKRYMDDSRFRYIRNEDNVGMRLNFRNALYEHATGEWAIFLTDDDYFLDSSYISKAIRLAGKDDKIVMVHANWLIIDETIASDKSETHLSYPEIVDGKWMFINYGKKGFRIIITSVLFKTSTAKRCKVLNNDVFSADIEFNLTLFLQGSVGFLNDVVVSRRIHKGGIGRSINWRMHFADGVKIYADMSEAARQLQCFEDKSIQIWWKRNVKRHFKAVLRQILNNGDIRSLRDFVREIAKSYPFAFKIFSIKTLIRCMFMRNLDLLDRFTLQYRGIAKGFKNCFR